MQLPRKRENRSLPLFPILCMLLACIYSLMVASGLVTTPVHAFAHGKEHGKEHGATLFHEKGCEYCHGARGIGGGKGPDLRDARKRYSKDQMVHQIAQGGGAMPAFGSSLQSSDIDDLVAYLRSKRK